MCFFRLRKILGCWGKNMEYKIDISVIVPVYNVEEYLEACLESLLRQGNARLEVIIIDDGSTDHSGDIAKKYAEQYEASGMIVESMPTL